MNKEEDLPESDQSDSDFCPEKEEAGADVSEASSEESSCSDENGGVAARKGAATKRSKVTGKKTKNRKRARAHKEIEASTDSDDDETVETCRRSTRQAEETNVNGRGKSGTGSLDKDKLESGEEDKSRTEALWADFLNDVSSKQQKPQQKLEQKLEQGKQADASSGKSDSNTAAAAAAAKITPPSTNGHHDEKKIEQKTTKPVVETSKAGKPTQITVTEVVDFAGEEVRVERIVNADSVKENKANTPQRTSNFAGVNTLPTSLKRSIPGGSNGAGGGGGGGGGLGSILGNISKKKKISVLEKSKLDWNSFKKDEGIEEEIQTFNKGKDGYLERQDFLQRTDLRQFEIEKGLRQTRRNN